MTVRDFIMVSSADIVTIIDGEKQDEFCLDHTDVSGILQAYGHRLVYIISATGEDQMEIIIQKEGTPGP